MDSSFCKESLHTSSCNIVKRPTPSRPSLIDVSRNPGDSFMRSFDFATPSPMTFVSSLLAEGPQEEEGEEEEDEEENCRSFSQLLAGAMDPPFTAVEKVFPSAPNTSNNNSGSSFAQRMAARNLESGGKVVALGAARWKSVPISRLSQPPSPYLTIPPGLSPAALLDSPVLIPFTRQAIPSPTTGNFPLPLLNPKNGPNIGLREEAANEIISNQLESSSFVFKLPPGIPYTFPDLVQEEGHTQMSSHPSNSTVSSSQKGALSIDTSKQEPMSDMVEDGVETKRPFRPTNASEKPADDGYNWRKYGQKQMKRSEYPRSYYRCSFPDCSAKKKVERSHEGQIIQIVYEGEHTHSKPPSTRRKSAAARIAKLAYSSAVTTNVARLPNELDSNELDNLSSVSDPLLGHSVATTTHLEPSSGSTSDIGCEDLDEPNAKRRKTWETTKVAFEGLKTVRKPRVVVQTKSEVDILDDGYRWRKYGQKVVKGNSYPRSYYKCTSFGCNVRKLVERCSMDKQSVITTYEGKHSHDVPDSENVRRNLSPPHPSRSGIADGNSWDSDGSQVRERLQGALEIVNREPPLTPSFLNKENIMDLYAQMFSSSFNEGD